jgi:hypothetical protein
MHATIEQLLSIRDGQPVAEAAAVHAAECEACRRELQRLSVLRAGLRELPELDPPRGLWSTVAVSAVSRPAPAAPRPWPALAGGVGIAAGIVLGIALVLNMTQAPDPGPARGTTTDLIAATPAPASSVNGVTTAELLETSRRLEAALRAMPAAPRVTRASTELTVAELQDRILEIDMLLNEPRLDAAGARTLWGHRVMLMDTLMQVRYAQLADAR